MLKKIAIRSLRENGQRRSLPYDWTQALLSARSHGSFLLSTRKQPPSITEDNKGVEMDGQIGYSDWLRRQFEGKREENRTSLLLEKIRSRPPLTVDNSYNKVYGYFITGQCITDLEWIEKNLVESADGIQSDLTLAHDPKIEGMYEYLYSREGIINRFPGMGPVRRKANLAKALCSMQSLTGDTYATFLKSWILPKEYNGFSKHLYKQREKSHKIADRAYIVKPDGASRGEGIYLIQDPSEYKFDPDRVDIVQEYLDPPLLLDGYKFDLRVYVVILRLNPLEIYICREGMARFCSSLYQHPNKENVQDLYMHVANSCLQRKFDQYVDNDNEDSGSKRTMSSVMKLLKERGLDVDQIWKQIKEQVGKSLLAITPELNIFHKSQFPSEQKCPSCFQILGVDFLLLENGHPKFIEINSNPSLRVYRGRTESSPGEYEYTNNMVDLKIKQTLMLDTLLLVATRKHDYQRKATNGSEKVRPGKSKDILSENEEDLEYLEKIDLATLIDQVSTNILLVEKLANLFHHCQEEPNKPYLGPTGFSAFLKKCSMQNITSGESANQDYLEPEELAKGIGFQRCLEIFLKHALERFPNESLGISCERMLNNKP